MQQPYMFYELYTAGQNLLHSVVVVVVVVVAVAVCLLPVTH
jgi:hypothetical protein